MASSSIPHISSQLPIQGERVLLVGFWGNGNLGDELILIGNLRLLLQQNKKPIVVAQHPDQLKKFCAQFLDVTQVNFIYELPRGFRSLRKYITNKHYLQFSNFYRIDSIILGGGEILTEENPNAYRYRFWSMRALFFSPNINFYIMGGVQIPRNQVNRHLFNYLLKRANKLYLRDEEAIQALKETGYTNAEFFMDTSYFSIQDWTTYKKSRTDTKKDTIEKKEKTDPYIILNLNSNAEKFYPEILSLVQEYDQKKYHIYYLPISKGNDTDIRYYQRFADAGIKNLQLIDREGDFQKLLPIWANADLIIGTRLHLFLVSKFLGVPVKTFPYQKKILKMKKMLDQLGF